MPIISIVSRINFAIKIQKTESEKTNKNESIKGQIGGLHVAVSLGIMELYSE